MKLRNKKTGEILGSFGSFIIQNPNHINCEAITKYDSLAELNEEWEDAPEEPKKYWYISPEGKVYWFFEDDEGLEASKQIGNYFETKEEAEKAVEKLKAWKRLKDKGFRFTGVEDVERTIRFEIPFRAGYDSCEAEVNLDFLFGGDE